MATGTGRRKCQARAVLITVREKRHRAPRKTRKNRSGQRKLDLQIQANAFKILDLFVLVGSQLYRLIRLVLFSRGYADRRFLLFKVGDFFINKIYKRYQNAISPT